MKTAEVTPARDPDQSGAEVNQGAEDQCHAREQLLPAARKLELVRDRRRSRNPDRGRAQGPAPLEGLPGKVVWTALPVRTELRAGAYPNNGAFPKAAIARALVAIRPAGRVLTRPAPAKTTGVRQGALLGKGVVREKDITVTATKIKRSFELRVSV